MEQELTVKVALNNVGQVCKAFKGLTMDEALVLAKSLALLENVCMLHEVQKETKQEENTNGIST